ncbi:MAG TPA: hypothetical protein DCZ11_03175, partial [Gammaproteobacteria bacterium]|nr:hypothetical protein [Gammaproteobacteria bacterium]MCH77428.1 hypothetical protein [Gammaproteobacteria bacterium]
VPFENLLVPEYWAHCTRVFREGDQIEVRAMDNAFWGVLLVAKVERLAIRMWALQRVNLEMPALAAAQIGA